MTKTPGRSSGQSLLELAVALPVLLILAAGVATVVRVVDAGGGLDAATAAAAAEAARQPSPEAAIQAADARFHAVVAGYPVEVQTFNVNVGTFRRGTQVIVTASADFDLGLAALPVPTARAHLISQSISLVEPWRSRGTPPVDPTPAYAPSPVPPPRSSLAPDVGAGLA